MCYIVVYLVYHLFPCLQLGTSIPPVFRVNDILPEDSFNVKGAPVTVLLHDTPSLAALVTCFDEAYTGTTTLPHSSSVIKGYHLGYLRHHRLRCAMSSRDLNGCVHLCNRVTYRNTHWLHAAE